MTREWGIVHHASPHELHRGPMIEDEALQWISEFEQDGGTPGSFLLVYREVSPWRRG